MGRVAKNPGWRDRRRWDFPDFPAVAKADWLARLLEHVTIRGVTAVKYDCSPTWDLPVRRIADDMFLFVMKGRFQARVEGRAVELFPGDAAHFRRGEWHSAMVVPRREQEIVSVHYTATVFESLTVAQLLDFPDRFELGGDAVVATVVEEACRVYAREPAGYPRLLEALAGQLLFRVILDHGAWLKAELPESRLADLRRLLPALEALRRELAEAPAIVDLAKRCGLSESQFRRVFQRTLGMHPVQYQRQARIEAACQLLRQTDWTVEAVAAAVGYAEPAFFAHTFKRMMGRPPGEYRRTAGV